MTLLVFGMDGAVREYVEEAIERGKMPNMEEFIENGVFGDMKSTKPPVTIPAWVSMFSGLRPDKIDTFHMTEMNDNYEVGINSSRDWKGKMIWDKLDARFGVLNVPGTSPAWDINGYMVEGFPMVEDPDVYPTDLLDDLPDMDFDPVHEQGSRKAKIEALFKNFSRRKKAFSDIGREVDVKVEVYQLTDTNSHKCKNLDEVLSAYEEVDKVLGEKMGEFDDIIIVSDHGFTHVDQYFYINTWLKEKGFLSEKESSIPRWKKLVQKFAGPLAETRFRPYLRSVNDFISNETGVDFAPQSSQLDEIDFANTEAFSYLRGTANYADININDTRWSKGKVEDREEVAEKVKEELEKEDFIQEVHLREDIYEKPENMPDLIVVSDSDIAIGPPLFSKYLFDTDAYVHSDTGIVAARGPSFSRGEIKGVEIVDIAPTIAEYLGQKLECDGKVLQSMFNSDFKPVKSSVTDIDI